jgi:hypothetical protein
MRHVALALALALAAMAPLVGCDEGVQALDPIDSPPLHVVEIQAATSVSGGQLVYAPIDPNGSTAVVPTTSFKLRFDRFLLPDTATRQALCVQPSLTTVESIADCAANAFFEPAYDPMQIEVTYRQFPNNPDTPPLIQGVTYELTAYIALEATDEGFRTFDGVGLGAPASVEFSVQAGAGPWPYDPISTADHFCHGPRCEAGSACVRPVSQMLAGCAYASCHAGDPYTAAEGLMLDTPAHIVETALGYPAHETEEGENGIAPDESPPRFGRAMPILDPGAAGNSYLIYKLLANAQIPLPVMLIAGERERVLDQIVVGMPMPPSTKPHALLRSGEPEWLGEWISQGAPVATCP